MIDGDISAGSPLNCHMTLPYKKLIFPYKAQKLIYCVS